MNIGFITNIRAPYRTLQLREYLKIPNTKINVYYTYPDLDGREWEILDAKNLNEYDLDVILKFGSYGYLNKGLYKLIKENDIIFLGGYEQPTIILISILCKIFKKPYIIFFDGISTSRLKNKEKGGKYLIKKFVVKNSTAIMANGEIGKKYFNTQFGVNEKNIYNQYLAIDNDKLRSLLANKKALREKYREKYGIDENSKVIMYSGRIVEIKNIKCLVKAISSIKEENITLFITGSGEQEEEIRKFAKGLNVNLIITGFLSKQEELFKHYCVADLFVLPSVEEPWGLVVNEAMNLEIPIIVSEICGCSLDLVVEGENGYKFDPYNEKDLSSKINKIFKDDYKKMGLKSKDIISKWNFKNSKNEINNIIKKINLKEL